MVPGQGFAGLADDISRTIDYHAVALEISSTRRRQTAQA